MTHSTYPSGTPESRFVPFSSRRVSAAGGRRVAPRSLTGNRRTLRRGPSVSVASTGRDGSPTGVGGFDVDGHQMRGFVIQVAQRRGVKEHSDLRQDIVMLLRSSLAQVECAGGTEASGGSEPGECVRESSSGLR